MSTSSTESYTPGTNANAVSFMARRSAATHARFFTPLLKKGMRLLDCGCGPGAITLDLARLVSPGAVTGIDRTDQFAAARAAAAAEGLPVRFETANIYDLPMEDGAFEAVFAHALFEHLAEPVRAAAEIRRVLVPGGFLGLRSPDWGGFLIHPFPEPVRQAIHLYRETMTENGGDVFAGRRLPSLLRQAGFTDIAASATYEIYEDPAVIADYLALQLEARDAEGAAALRAWAKDPDALFAQAWGEAVGRKP